MTVHSQLIFQQKQTDSDGLYQEAQRKEEHVRSASVSQGLYSFVPAPTTHVKQLGLKPPPVFKPKYDISG